MEKTTLNIEDILTTENVAELLPNKDLDQIAADCLDRFDADLQSRSGWRQKMDNALKLSMQVVEKKNFPWPNASNVKFPTVTIASLQFNARALPAILNSQNIVRHKVVGPDPDLSKTLRAERVSLHMNYQLTDQDETWIEEQDKLLMALPILGCAFKKSYFDPEKGYVVAYYVSPLNLVVNYHASSLDTAHAATEILPEISAREMTERQRLGLYIDTDLSDVSVTQEEYQKDWFAKDREGLTPPQTDQTTSWYCPLEQHCFLDLDGDDYPEPYVVTVERNSRKVLRIVPRFYEEDIIYNPRDEREIAKIVPEVYYDKYTFVPSPDGGFYELGFGVLLAPINDTINTLINQLIDAGTLATMPTGLVGKGARLKKGNYRFKPGEFKTVNATVDDLKKSVFLIPFKEPSGTLLNMLSLLVEYSERIPGITDIAVGKTPGQNTPATTSMTSLEQSQKVFSGIFLRLHKCLTQELKRRYYLNSIYLQPEQYFEVVKRGTENEYVPQQVFQMDYQGSPDDVVPASDPNAASDQTRIMKAEALRNAAMTSGLYDVYEVEKRYLEAMKIPGIDQVLPPPGSEKAPQPQPGKDAIALMKLQADEGYRATKLPLEMDLIDAQIAKLEADALKSLAQAEAEDDKLNIANYKNVLASFKEKREAIAQQKQLAAQAQQQQQGAAPGGQGSGGPGV